MTMSTAVTADLSRSVSADHHRLSRAACARLVGRARRRPQCSRAQFCCKDLLMFRCSITFHFHLDFLVMEKRGTQSQVGVAIGAASLISKMCVSRSYWCLIPTRMWWCLEAANKTSCWWWNRTWGPAKPKTKLRWNICLLWTRPRLATPPEPFTQICWI